MDFLTINVNSYTEEKNGLTYLSWAHAWTEVLKADPLATWEAVEFNGLPCAFLPDSTALVKTIVTIKGHAKSCWLPVIDHRNKPIPNPNAFNVNTAIVRCLTKAISMHGLGLYIYAGEDLPLIDTEVLDRVAAELVQLHNEKLDLEACNIWYSRKDIQSNDAKEYLWKQLHEHSALRSALKANKPQLKAA